jgi:hypothetical protein
MQRKEGHGVSPVAASRGCHRLATERGGEG